MAELEFLFQHSLDSVSENMQMKIQHECATPFGNFKTIECHLVVVLSQKPHKHLLVLKVKEKLM